MLMPLMCLLQRPLCRGKEKGSRNSLRIFVMDNSKVVWPTQLWIQGYALTNLGLLIAGHGEEPQAYC